MNYIYLWRSNELGGKAGLINSALIDFIKCLLFTLKHIKLRWFSATVAVFYVHLPAHKNAPGCLSACLRWQFIFLSSVTNRSSTPFVSPHLRSAVFIFHFLLKMLPSLHASALHPPTHKHTHSISVLSLQLSACPFLPALPSADHVLITPQRNALPPHTVHLSWCSPLCSISVRYFFALTSIPRIPFCLLCSSYSLHLPLSSHHTLHSSGKLLFPCFSQKLHTLQQRVHNAGKLEQKPR